MSELKICPACEEEKPQDEFYKGYARCKVCRNKYMDEYARTHPDYVKRRVDKLNALHEQIKADPVRSTKLRQRRNRLNSRKDREYKFGLTHEQYQAKSKMQGDVCAICKNPETVKNKKGEVRTLAVDHCHKTDRIRDLLCFRCNTKLHVLEDENFRSVAEAYLASHEQSDS